MPRPYDQACPIAKTLDIVGDRWTLLIIRDLMTGTTRFHQFLESSRGLPPKLLSERLKRLVEHDLVERSIYSQHPLRAEYSLTKLGLSLRPVLEAMAHWGVEHCFEGDPEAHAGVAGKLLQVERR